jgi:hypothetical protein
MSNHEQFWREVVDDHRPRPLELLRSEFELGSTPATPLPPPRVEAMYTKVGGVIARMAVRRWRRHRLVAALVLATSLATAGWVGAVVIRSTTVPTPMRLDHAGALEESQTAPEEAGRLLAVALLEDHLLDVARALQRLAADKEPWLASEATIVRCELHAFWEAREPATWHGQDPVELAEAAEDTTRPLAERFDAVAALPAAVAPALAALRDARFTEPRSVQMTAFMQKRVVRVLTSDVSR